MPAYIIYIACIEQFALYTYEVCILNYAMLSVLKVFLINKWCRVERN
jgi:hypothetical protein